MIFKLTQFELRAHFKQIGFWIAALLLAWMTFIVTGQRGSNLLFANSAFAITQTTLFIVPNIIFVVCVLASSTLLRDSQYKMEPLIFATPIDKFEYLTSRFLGLLFATLTLMLFTIAVMMLTLIKLDPALVGPFRLQYYFAAFCIFMVPTAIFACCVVFATAMFSKSMIAVYVSGIVVYVLYIIGSVFGNSPLLANSSPILESGSGFSSLLEPYGFIAFMAQSATWSVQQKNVLMPLLSGELLANRILWLAISAGLFAFTYQCFSFRKAKTVNAKKAEPAKTLGGRLFTQWQAVAVNHNFTHFNLAIWWSKIKLEYRTVTKGFTFIVLLVVTVVFSVALLIGNIFSGPISGGQPYFPSTELILEMLEQPLSDIGMLVAIFFTVELFWNERNVNINGLIDATPTRNFTLYFAKLATVLAVGFSLITVSILCAIAFQLSQQYYNIDLFIYLSLYYYAGVPILLITLLTLFLQRFATTKSLGLLFGFGVFFANIFVKAAIFEHPLISFAYRPQFIFSDMTEAHYHLDALHWYNAYWVSFALILAVLTVKMWQRGISTVNQSIGRMGVATLSVAAIGMLVSGSYIYSQVNIEHDFVTTEQRFDQQEQYEKRYQSFKNMAVPTVTDITADVDIFPKERSYHVKGRYQFENKTVQMIDKLLVSVVSSGAIDAELTLEGASLIEFDEVNNQYIYQFNTPLLPNAIGGLSFNYVITHSPFVELDGEHYVTEKGSYIELEDVIPQFGYDSRLAINSEREREKRKLASMLYPAPTRNDQKIADDWVNFETTVSTSADQSVVAVGKLENSWKEGDRNYFYYKSNGKINTQFAYVSAEFTEHKKYHKGVDITIYHHPKHDKDNALVNHALTHTMDYFSKNFKSYENDYFTVAELPYFSSNQSFGSAQPGVYLGVENRFFNLNNEGAEVNPLLRGVSHEFAHQYWGNYIEPNYIGGYAILTETLCKYTELVMARQLYGEYAANEEVHLSIDRYLNMRSHNPRIENPLYAAGFEPFLYYAKGKQVMHAMLGLLGEEKINLALKGLLTSHGYPKKPTSLDLLDAFYGVANEKQKLIIDDMFKRVVFHDFEIHSAETAINDEGLYATEIDVSTLKLVLDQKTNQEMPELINDAIEIGLYSGFPEVDNSNMLTLTKLQFNSDRSVVTVYSTEKPQYVQIDPNRYRIDRAVANNVMEIQ